MEPNIEKKRSKILSIDAKMASLLRERLQLAAEIGTLKQSIGFPIVDPRAERNVVENLRQAAKKEGFSEAVADRLAGLLLRESKSLQINRFASGSSESKDQVFKRIIDIAQELAASGSKVIRMEVGEPGFAPPKIAAQTARQALAKRKLFPYGPSAGISALRDAIAQALNEEHGCSLSRDQVLVTAGGRYAVYAAIMTSPNQLDPVIIPEPAWPAYEECVNLAGCTTIPVPTSLEGNWDLDLSKVEDHLAAGARMIAFGNPNNPNGKVFDEKTIGQLVSLGEKYGATILSDEVYSEYARRKVPSILEHEESDFLYVGSFSKNFGMTGWRLGFVVTRKERIRKILSFIETTLTSVPEFIQAAAVKVLEKGQPDAKRKVASVMRRVEIACGELRKINVSFYPPDGTFYIFPKANIPKFDSMSFASDLLKNRKVGIAPGSVFGDYNEFFRLSVAIPERDLVKGIKILDEELDALESSGRHS